MDRQTDRWTHPKICSTRPPQPLGWLLEWLRLSLYWLDSNATKWVIGIHCSLRDLEYAGRGVRTIERGMKDVTYTAATMQWNELHT